MPAYAYPIKIHYGRQTIREEHSTLLDNPLTVRVLQELVGDAAFSIRDADEVPFDDRYTVNWSTNRLETDEEMNARIAHEEAYMQEYNKRYPKA